MNDRPTDDLRVVRKKVSWHFSGTVEGNEYREPLVAVQRRWEVKNPKAKGLVCTTTGFIGLDESGSPVPAFISEWRDLPEVEG